MSLSASWDSFYCFKIYFSFLYYYYYYLFPTYVIFIVYCMFSDNDGPYYWHIKSGTIQRELPQSDKKQESKRVTLRDTENVSILPHGCS